VDLENRIMDRINEMLKKLLGSFADKNDTKKRLAALEKNVIIIRNISFFYRLNHCLN
jgi:hypothetical protein